MDIFYSNINDKCSKLYLLSSTFPFWFSREYKKLIYLKKIAQKINKQFPSWHNYNTFSNFLNKSQNLYPVIQNISGSLLIINAIIHLFLCSCLTIITQKYSGGNRISNSFFKYFSSVFNSSVTPLLSCTKNIFLLNLNSASLSL